MLDITYIPKITVGAFWGLFTNERFSMPFIEMCYADGEFTSLIPRALITDSWSATPRSAEQMTAMSAIYDNPARVAFVLSDILHRIPKLPTFCEQEQQIISNAFTQNISRDDSLLLEKWLDTQVAQCVGQNRENAAFWETMMVVNHTKKQWYALKDVYEMPQSFCSPLLYLASVGSLNPTDHLPLFGSWAFDVLELTGYQHSKDGMQQIRFNIAERMLCDG